MLFSLDDAALTLVFAVTFGARLLAEMEPGIRRADPGTLFCRPSPCILVAERWCRYAYLGPRSVVLVYPPSPIFLQSSHLSND